MPDDEHRKGQHYKQYAHVFQEKTRSLIFRLVPLGGGDIPTAACYFKSIKLPSTTLSALFDVFHPESLCSRLFQSFIKSLFYSSISCSTLIVMQSLLNLKISLGKIPVSSGHSCCHLLKPFKRSALRDSPLGGRSIE
jgi:hypothetical protein